LPKSRKINTSYERNEGGRRARGARETRETKDGGNKPKRNRKKKQKRIKKNLRGGCIYPTILYYVYYSTPSGY
jgi:hypothetical protein